MSNIKIQTSGQRVEVKVNRVDHFYHDLWNQYKDWCLGKSIKRIAKPQIPRFENFEGYVEYRMNGGI